MNSRDMQIVKWMIGALYVILSISVITTLLV